MASAGPESRSVAIADRGGGLAARILGYLFNRVKIDREVEDLLRKAYERGNVVFVLRVRRVLDPLFLLHTLRRLGLPRPQWMHEHYSSQRPATTSELISSLKAEEPALLFLRRPRTLGQQKANYAEKHVEALIELQKEQTLPIQLIPIALISTRRSSGLRRSIIDAIFGDREAPGRIREFLGFFFKRKDARFHVGVAVELNAVLEREESRPIETIGKKSDGRS